MDKTKAIQVVKLLQRLVTLAELSTIIDTFFTAFIEKPVTKYKDGIVWLFGNFNITGTKSGRLSSSQVNLQNIPSGGSDYAPAVKECFVAPENYLLVGIDFESLEDKISALTTRDPNKIKVYTDNYCGHSMRAYSYFSSEMPDIVDTVDSINSIAKKYPKLRQKSKVPTFALTYSGTYKTLVKNLGMSEEEAKSIEKNYHELYKVSDDWVQAGLVQASINGYATAAFGLRLRTPILSQVVWTSGNVPQEAARESRTVGNFFGQSYGQLNNRAGVEFQNKLFESEYVYDILPISQIHDAQYFLVKKDVDTLHWFNKTIVKCVEWQDLPELMHDKVKLGGSVEVFYPSWNNPHHVDKNATRDDIEALFNKLNL